MIEGNQCSLVLVSQIRCVDSVHIGDVDPALSIDLHGSQCGGIGGIHDVHSGTVEFEGGVVENSSGGVVVGGQDLPGAACVHHLGNGGGKVSTDDREDNHIAAGVLQRVDGGSGVFGSHFLVDDGVLLGLGQVCGLSLDAGQHGLGGFVGVGDNTNLGAGQAVGSGSKCPQDQAAAFGLVQGLDRENTLVALFGGILIEQNIITGSGINHGNLGILDDVQVGGHGVAAEVTDDGKNLVLMDQLFGQSSGVGANALVVIVLQLDGLAIEAAVCIVDCKSSLNALVEGSADGSQSTGGTGGVADPDGVFGHALELFGSRAAACQQAKDQNQGQGQCEDSVELLHVVFSFSVLFTR